MAPFSRQVTAQVLRLFLALAVPRRHWRVFCFLRSLVLNRDRSAGKAYALTLKWSDNRFTAFPQERPSPLAWWRRWLKGLVATSLFVVGLFPCYAQGPEASTPQAVRARKTAQDTWFLHGRALPGQPTATLRTRARAQKARMSSAPTAKISARVSAAAQAGLSWKSIGPLPFASDASGTGLQDYGWVSGRTTTVVIDPSDPTGNTVYVGAAYGGVWKSTNAGTLAADPASVRWFPLSDDQATLAIGSLAVQPGNSDPATTVILAGTGEANNATDNYYGLGILRSGDGGKTWTLIETAGTRLFAGLGIGKIAFNPFEPNVAVAAASATFNGMVFDLERPLNTNRGLYYSQDAGRTWNYARVLDRDTTIVPSSAMSVIYNAGEGRYYAAIQYHGFYGSFDGVTWLRLAVQPGPGLSTANCPANQWSPACPIYRAEFAVVPGRNEMYVWYVDSNDNDQGIWKTVNGGATWTAVSTASMANCGDVMGCETEQGYYNLTLAAVPNGTVTDLYAGAVNLYKCTITDQWPTCTGPGKNQFLNLTHVYGCPPNFGSTAHVYPSQHGIDFAVMNNKAVMFFATDGGVYRALDAYSGLTTGTCGGSNQFDNLNQNLGPLTQFVSLSQHPSDVNTLIGGTNNGLAATTNASQSTVTWQNINTGSNGHTAINPNNPLEWFTENSGISIQRCANGAACREQDFQNAWVVNDQTLSGDAGPFYVPFILDPSASTSELIVGTCRVWRGPGVGGAFVALSDSLENGTSGCTGTETNVVRALAAGGAPDSSGLSKVIYAGTDGLGAVSYGIPGGHVWNTTNAVGGPTTWLDRTNDINPSAYPVSAIALDPADSRGYAAFVTLMGFYTSHVWKTENAGVSWVDFTGSGSSALPDAPADAVVVDQATGTVYVATDVGVFSSPTSMPVWTEVGPSAGTGALPNVAVTSLRLFSGGGVKRLRATTYGRGVWEISLFAGPDFELSLPVASKTAYAGSPAIFSGTLAAFNGYANQVTLTCIQGTTAPPTPCSATPSPLLPTGQGAGFTLSAGGTAGDYSFKIRGVGGDANTITHDLPVDLHIVDFSLAVPSPSAITVARGTVSSDISFNVNALGSAFNGVIDLTCSGLPAGASCSFSPAATVMPTAGAPVSASIRIVVPGNTATGNSTVTITGRVAGTPALHTRSFALQIVTNTDFVLSVTGPFPAVKARGMKSGPISIASQDGFTGTVSLSCAVAGGGCSVSPVRVSTFPATATVTVDATALNAGTNYSAVVTGISGSKTRQLSVPFVVTDYGITAGTPTTSGQTVTSTVTLSPINAYSGRVSASCDPSGLPGGTCTLSPSGPFTVGLGSTTFTLNVGLPSGAYPAASIIVSTQDTDGAPKHTVSVPISAGGGGDGGGGGGGGGGGSDFTLNAATGPQTVKAGQPARYALTIGPMGPSYDAAVTLSCSNLPALTACTFSPSPVTPGASSANVSLVVNTTASISAKHRMASPLFYALCIPGFGLVIAGVGRKHSALALLVLCALVLSLATLLGCGGGTGAGGGGNQPGTPSGTYQISVTATSDALAPKNVQVTLVVQ